MNNYIVKNTITQNWIDDVETKESFDEYFCNRYLETFTRKTLGLESGFFFATSPFYEQRVYEGTIQDWLEFNNYTSELPPQVRTEEEIRQMRL